MTVWQRITRTGLQPLYVLQTLQSCWGSGNRCAGGRERSQQTGNAATLHLFPRREHDEVSAERRRGRQRGGRPTLLRHFEPIFPCRLLPCQRRHESFKSLALTQKWCRSRWREGRNPGRAENIRNCSEENQRNNWWIHRRRSVHHTKDKKRAPATTLSATHSCYVINYSFKPMKCLRGSRVKRQSHQVNSFLSRSHTMTTSSQSSYVTTCNKTNSWTIHHLSNNCRLIFFSTDSSSRRRMAAEYNVVMSRFYKAQILMHFSSSCNWIFLRCCCCFASSTLVKNANTRSPLRRETFRPLHRETYEFSVTTQRMCSSYF